MTAHEKLVKKSKILYESVGCINSPALNNNKIHFTADGLHHLLFTTTRGERPEAEQAAKLRFLEDALELIRISTTYQEYEVRTLRTKIKRKKRVVFENVDVKYWALIAIINGRRIKVIIRRAGNGQHCFWSIIPNWQVKKLSGHPVKSTATGSPEED